MSLLLLGPLIREPGNICMDITHMHMYIYISVTICIFISVYMAVAFIAALTLT